MADQLAERAGVNGYHRQAGRHRFHGGQALQLRLGHDGEDVGQPVNGREVGFGDEAKEPHLPGESKRLRLRPQPGLVRPGADYGHLRVGGQPGRRVQQDVHALLRAEPADREDQRSAGRQSIASRIWSSAGPGEYS